MFVGVGVMRETTRASLSLLPVAAAEHFGFDRPEDRFGNPPANRERLQGRKRHPHRQPRPAGGARKGAPGVRDVVKRRDRQSTRPPPLHSIA
jgi:hypothetical protein